MKKILFSLLILFPGVTLLAQPWMPANTHQPVKLKDVIANYKLSAREDEEKEEREMKEDGKVEKEGKDYFFQRWAWYWQQHLDEQGYMVPPARTWEEWNKYYQQHTENVASKNTTGTPANWTFAGPDSTGGGYWGIGRINAIAVHPTDTSVLFAGTAGGGTWKSTDGGGSWAPLYSNFPTVGVSDITINPKNPNTIYVCTGDADGYGNYSMGIIKTLDGGSTWNITGMAWTPFSYIWARSLIMNPLDTNTLMLAARDGIHITHNGGSSWTTLASGDFKQVLYRPGDTTTVYASRYALYPDSSAQILRSTNGGVTWTQISHFTQAERINLAVCPSSPNIVKALASSRKASGLLGIYGSTNKGASFSPLYENDTSCTKNLLGYELGLPTSQCNGQGWYDLCIAINPTDSSKVIIGGVNNYYSTNGGSTWSIVTTWYGGIPSVNTVHADKHCLIYNPLNLKLYEGCDGGIYKTTDPVSGTWTNITNGMGITQFYRNAVANGVNWCIGGAQDNGTQMVGNPAYLDLTGGDGMQCQIDYESPTTTWYTASQNGYINRTVDAGAHYSGISGSIPDTLGGIWITPYIIHPLSSNILLAGIDILFKSLDQGSTWVPISPQFSSNSKINHIAMSPNNGNYIYLTLENNTLHFSPDFGNTWDTISTISFSNNISRIKVDPFDSNVVWLTFSGYGSKRVASYNRTAHAWINHNSGLPTIPVNCIAIDSFSGTKYIGTDAAIYYLDTTMTSWALYNTNLPSVNIEDLNINYSTNELWAATYGRGMWHTTKREFPTQVSTVPFLTDVTKIVPNPSKGSFTINTTHPEFVGQQVTVKLISVNGTAVWQEEKAFDSAGNLKVNAKGLPAGAYICETVNDKMMARSRVVIY